MREALSWWQFRWPYLQAICHIYLLVLRRNLVSVWVDIPRCRFLGFAQSQLASRVWHIMEFEEMITRGCSFIGAFGPPDTVAIAYPSNTGSILSKRAEKESAA